MFNKAEGDGDLPPPVRVDAQELLLNLFREQDEASRGPGEPGGGG